MSWVEVAGRCKHFYSAVKDELEQFSGNELATAAEKRDVLVRTLQKHYCYDRRRAEQELESLCRRH